LEVVEKSGKKINLYIGTFPMMGGKNYFLKKPPSKKTVERQVLGARRFYENFLKNGGVLFLLSTSRTWLELNRKELREQLPVLLYIATSKKSLYEKESELENLKIMNIYHGGYVDFITSLREIPPDLAERLAPFGDPAVLTARRKARIEKEQREKAIRDKKERIAGEQAEKEYRARMRKLFIQQGKKIPDKYLEKE
jgi:hypothetical protein